MKTLNLSMKILSLIVILSFYASCEKWELGIKGEGPSITKNLEMSEVQGIYSELPAKIYLSQGDEQSINIEAQQNIIDNIESSIHNKILKLKFNRDVSRCSPIKIYMTIRTLNEVSLTGSGEIISTSKFNANQDLIINLTGSGKINISCDAQLVDLRLSGSGNINLSTNCKEFYGNLSGSGNIDLANGRASIANITVSGSGDLYAFNFPVESCNVRIAGSGDSRVNTLEKLTVKIAGSGKVYYTGNPQLSVIIVGSGNVVNAN